MFNLRRLVELLFFCMIVAVSSSSELKAVEECNPMIVCHGPRGEKGPRGPVGPRGPGGPEGPPGAAGTLSILPNIESYQNIIYLWQNTYPTVPLVWISPGPLEIAGYRQSGGFTVSPYSVTVQNAGIYAVSVWLRGLTANFNLLVNGSKLDYKVTDIDGQGTADQEFGTYLVTAQAGDVIAGAFFRYSGPIIPDANYLTMVIQKVGEVNNKNMKVWNSKRQN